MVKSKDEESTAEDTLSENSVALEAEFVNFTIKVQREQRLHWLIEAKKQKTSLTAAIVEALNARFGSPH